MAVKLQKYARKSAVNGLFAHSSALTLQIAAVLPSFGYDQFVRLQRYKPLKTGRFPAALHLACKQIDKYHFDPVYEFTA